MPILKSNTKCLLIKTKDERKFLTDRSNLVQLIEFAKTFEAEVHLAESHGASILELSELPEALCDPLYKSPDGIVSLEKLIPEASCPVTRKRRSRSESTAIGKEISLYIQAKFLAGDVVSLKNLSMIYASYKLSASYFSSRIALIKSLLEKQGMQIERVARGAYKVREEKTEPKYCLKAVKWHQPYIELQ